MKIKFKTTLIGVITGFVNGLFGSGGGSFLVPSMQKFLKVEQYHAHATAIAVILPLSIISTVVYYLKGIKSYNLPLIITVSLGGVVGGFIGAKCLKKIPKKLLSKIFGIFIIIAAVKMLA